MEYEIEEPFNPASWELDWRWHLPLNGQVSIQHRMPPKALEIPESEEP